MIYGFEHHDQLLELWRETDLRDIHLVHVDFHDDMRGLVIDRKRQVAYPTGALARGKAEVDPGNFLAHAILDGRINGVRWLHGIPGGRAWDAGIVGYESDWLALPQRLRQRFAPASQRGSKAFSTGWAAIRPPTPMWPTHRSTATRRPNVSSTSFVCSRIASDRRFSG